MFLRQLSRVVLAVVEIKGAAVDVNLEVLVAAGVVNNRDVVVILGVVVENASQLRETTMLPGARRLVQLTIKNGDKSMQVMDMLLSKKGAPDRKEWLEDKGNLADV